MRRKSPRFMWLPALCAGAVLCVAAVGAVAAVRQPAISSDPGRAARVSAVDYAGRYRILLSLGGSDPGGRSVRIAVSKGGRAITHAHVAVSFERHPLTSRLSYAVPAQAGFYSRRIPIHGTGAWSIRVALRGRGVVGRHVAPFILYQPSSRLTSSTKLLTQTSPSDPAVAFSIGPYRAELRVAYAPSMESTFRLLLRSGGTEALPSAVTLDGSMIEMDMGVVRTSLHRARRAYVGFAQLPMAGPWSVAVTAGRFSATIALWLASDVVKDSSSDVGGGFLATPFPTGLPYRGFVTEMRADRLARFNSGIAPAGRTPHGVDFVPHAPYAFVTDMGSNDVRVIDIHSGRTVAVIPVGVAPAHIAFTPDAGKAFVTDFLSSDVAVIDVQHRRLITQVPVGLNPHGLDITPDGRYVYVACVHGGGVYVLNAATNRVVSVIPTGLEPYGVTMGPRGSGQAFVSDYAMDQVDVVSLKAHRVVKRIKVGRSPALMVAAPNGLLYVANHGSGSVTALRMKTGRVVASIRVGSGPHGLDITPDGRYVYVADNNSNTVSIISTALGRVTHTVRVPGEPNEVALRQPDDLQP